MNNRFTTALPSLPRPGGNGNRDELLTAKESCQFLKVSRSTLWRKFPPTMKIGSLPRWTKSALLQGG